MSFTVWPHHLQVAADEAEGGASKPELAYKPPLVGHQLGDPVDVFRQEKSQTEHRLS